MEPKKIWVYFFLAEKLIFHSINHPYKGPNFGGWPAVLNIIRMSCRRRFRVYSGAFRIGAKKNWYFFSQIGMAGSIVYHLRSCIQFNWLWYFWKGKLPVKATILIHRLRLPGDGLNLARPRNRKGFCHDINFTKSSKMFLSWVLLWLTPARLTNMGMRSDFRYSASTTLANSPSFPEAALLTIGVSSWHKFRNWERNSPSTQKNRQALVYTVQFAWQKLDTMTHQVDKTYFWLESRRERSILQIDHKPMFWR